jgi:aspartate racemase
MRTLGLIGGMSWESTVPYYQHINRFVAQRLGGLHSARLLLYSVDFHEVEEWQRSGRWDEAGALLAGAAAALERAGAECLVLCTNTMHKVAPAIEASVRVPLLHIADPTGAAIQRRGFRRVGLLGTRFTMEEPFYRSRLRERFHLDVIVPGQAGRDVVHEVIYEELCRGVVSETSRGRFQDIVEGLRADGAEGVILGCTEIGLLLRDQDARVPLFDTTRLHAEAAAEYAIAGG